MQKVERQVLKILSKITSEIETNHNIDVTPEISAVMGVTKERVRCIGKTAVGKPCRYLSKPGEEYCVRHVPLEGDDEEVRERVQCAALTANGMRCIRDARHGETLCGGHVYQMGIQSRKPKTYACVYYDDDEEDIERCERRALPGKWVCKKHDAHNVFFSTTFGYDCHEGYVNRQDTDNTNAIVEENLRQI